MARAGWALFGPVAAVGPLRLLVRALGPVRRGRFGASAYALSNAAPVHAALISRDARPRSNREPAG